MVCGSPVSAVLCVSIPEESLVRSSSRVIDRHTPILIDGLRSKPSDSHCVSIDEESLVRSSSRVIDRHTPILIDGRISKPSAGHPRTQRSPPLPNTKPNQPKKTPGYQQRPINQTDDRRPPSSSRYLLSDDALLNISSSFHPVAASPLSPSPSTSFHSVSPSNPVHPSELTRFPAAPSSFNPKVDESPTSNSNQQVVVLRVSLHCKGCVGKVRKHLSGLEGVKSFNIDFPAKKVTVIGSVSPEGLLASVSRVKKAQLWSGFTVEHASPKATTTSCIKQ